MYKFPLRRSYETGWYTLERQNAIDGMTNSLSRRKGVKNIYIGSCIPTQLEGDKGYKMHVSYEEDLDETFELPEGLEKVIFLDVDSSVLPYGVDTMAKEIDAGIVMVSPKLKDNFYDVGDYIPQNLYQLMDEANKRGAKVVGITPSIGTYRAEEASTAEKIEYGIMRYLHEHPSIKNFLILSKEDLEELSAHQIKETCIGFYDEAKAKDILNGNIPESERETSFEDWYRRETKPFGYSRHF